ncbi:MAG: 6-carboxytetrahydropterin synthase [Cryomorphaceae bacterium]|jgi:6-pyruvoyltetrahydropterin/6-carboxytetrahydropterin synthase|nr:6-carboxytetrahydropterin synthase [Cryomorphaceae bacterium]
MYTIEREFSIAIAHSLSNHEGRCRNFHGHNIDILVEVKSEELNDNNMVMDFSDLKDLCNKYIDPLDHSMLLNETETEMIKLLQKQNKRFHIFNNDPTAEHLCKYLFESIERDLEFNYPEIEVDRVTIYENEKSNATYSRI